MDGSNNLWSKKDLPNLRAPKLNAESSESQASESIIAKSTLSAEAKEFFPKGYFETNANVNQVSNQKANSNSVQNRLARPTVTTNDQTDVIQYQYDDVNESELEYLHEVIVLLTSNPGKFDEKIPTLVDSLHVQLGDTRMVKCIVSSIVEQAISEPNFGYSGARMCAVLRKYSTCLQYNLLACCEKIEFEPQYSEHARNFTLFLAELFSQFDWDPSFGVCLLTALKTLLNFGTDNDVKCVCQTLKLTGMSLETLNKEAVDSIISRMEGFLPQLNSSCTNLLHSVIALRAAQWGGSMRQQSATVPISSALSDYPPETPFAQRWSDGGPVFYGPDGHELSAEENAFLNDATDEFAPEDSDPDALWDPDPEMDEEIKAAFKVFVAMNKK